MQLLLVGSGGSQNLLNQGSFSQSALNQDPQPEARHSQQLGPQPETHIPAKASIPEPELLLPARNPIPTLDLEGDGSCRKDDCVGHSIISTGYEGARSFGLQNDCRKILTRLEVCGQYNGRRKYNNLLAWIRKRSMRVFLQLSTLIPSESSQLTIYPYPRTTISWKPRGEI